MRKELEEVHLQVLELSPEGVRNDGKKQEEEEEEEKKWRRRLVEKLHGGRRGIDGERCGGEFRLVGWR